LVFFVLLLFCSVSRTGLLNPKTTTATTPRKKKKKNTHSPKWAPYDLVIHSAGYLERHGLSHLAAEVGKFAVGNGSADGAMASLESQMQVNAYAPMRVAAALISKQDDTLNGGWARARRLCFFLCFFEGRGVDLCFFFFFFELGGYSSHALPLPHFLTLASSDTTVLAVISSRMGSIGDNAVGGGGASGMYGYRMSKAAVNAGFHALAVDLRAGGGAQCVAVLHPGYVKTDMTGGKGNVTPAESVTGMLNVLEKMAAEDSGKFFHMDGSELPW
jgi:NAD(P)-dependent dehydrogenase (short-subunit alcohol dehydrogenase family)